MKSDSSLYVSNFIHTHNTKKKHRKGAYSKKTNGVEEMINDKFKSNADKIRNQAKE